MLLPATFHEPAQLWAIDPSLLLLVHICGTIHHFISVTLNYRFPSFAGYWKRICLAEDRPTFRCSAPYKCTYLLTYLQSINAHNQIFLDICKERSMSKTTVSVSASVLVNTKNWFRSTSYRENIYFMCQTSDKELFVVIGGQVLWESSHQAPPIRTTFTTFVLRRPVMTLPTLKRQLKAYLFHIIIIR